MFSCQATQAMIRGGNLKISYAQASGFIALQGFVVIMILILCCQLTSSRPAMSPSLGKTLNGESNSILVAHAVTFTLSSSEI
jgi:hypothetical protein